ncbi:MAG: hypothetical protein ACWGMZ_04735, partial [Thermoguttaceae bacterium]
MDEFFINIGSEKSSLFIKMSSHLINCLKKNPMAYYAVEEAIECQKKGYYGVGIIVFAQILRMLGHDSPPTRNDVAHRILKKRPTKEAYNEILESVKKMAIKQSDSECRRYDTIAGYNRKIAK